MLRKFLANRLGFSTHYATSNEFLISTPIVLHPQLGSNTAASRSQHHILVLEPPCLEYLAPYPQPTSLESLLLHLDVGGGGCGFKVVTVVTIGDGGGQCGGMGCDGSNVHGGRSGNTKMVQMVVW